MSSIQESSEMEMEEDKKEMQKDEPSELQTTTSADFVEDRIRALQESDETDFDAWTSLVAEIEKSSPNNMKRIQLVYDSFLSEFPLCFGYWKKYASHVAHLCTLNEVEEIYERAVQAAPYSVDLWVSYCSFGILSYEHPDDVRRLFAKALSFVGKDYLCNILWDKYIEFEYSQKQWSCLAHIYINTLKFPTKKLHIYYESLKKLVAIWEGEMGWQNRIELQSEAMARYEADAKACEYAEISDVVRDLLGGQGGHPKPDIVKKYLSIGEQLYYRSSQIDRNISLFEARIRRPYFHVKALDDRQLENWHQYLDFVELQGDFDWMVKLYERCLIACANYSEFWIRYVEFVNAKGGREIANYALGRALTIFLKRVPAFRFYSAMFKEKVGDATGARASFLECNMDLSPSFIQNVKREANMEKRLGNIEAACTIYEKAIAMAKLKQDSHTLSILYDAFALLKFVVTGSIDAAREVFMNGIQQMPCKSILEGLIHFVTMLGGPGQISKVDDIIADAISPNSDISQGLSCSDREEISRLFLEFVDLHGTIDEIRKAWDRHRRLFPHVLTPKSTFSNTTSGKNSLDKNMELRTDTSIVSLQHEDGVSGRDDSCIKLVANPSLQNNAATVSEGAALCNLQTENNNKDVLMEREGYAEPAGVQKESILEEDGLHVVVNESIQENHSLPQKSEELLKNPETDYPEQRHPDHEHGDDIQEWHRDCEPTGDTRPTSFDNLSDNSPGNGAQKLKSCSHGCNNAQEATSRSPGDETRNACESSEAFMVHESNKIDMRSNTPSEAEAEKNNSPLHPTTNQSLSDVGKSPEFQTQAQLQSNCRNELPVSEAYAHNDHNGGSKSQACYRGEASQDPNTEILGHAQASQTQQWHVQALAQHPTTRAHSHMAVAQGHLCQPQSWTNTQNQPANQTQSQYQMTGGQVYSHSNFVWPGQSTQQQGFGYAQPQPDNHPTSQPQKQVYQQAQQGNEQYGYIQSDQGYPSHIWQYYQQQLFYLQQQQLQNQQQMHQLRQQQQLNQQQLNQQDQQRTSQYQQQNQQVHNQQLQQQLLYLQQQQHVLQQQQQQLVLFQQQQQQQHHQPQHLQQQYHQYQQLLQQHQLLFQQQQQQQLLQQQRQQQWQEQLPKQQQQMAALDLTALDSTNCVQQTVPEEQYVGHQHNHIHGQQNVISQGEGAKRQKPEQSVLSNPSIQQQASPYRQR